MLKRCSNVSLATLRIALCEIDAKSALRSSPNTVVNIRAIPSAGVSRAINLQTRMKLPHTSGNAGSGQDSDAARWCDRDVHTVDDILEVEGDLDVQHFASHKET